jgi:hypothetical protein
MALNDAAKNSRKRERTLREDRYCEPEKRKFRGRKPKKTYRV